MLERLLSDYDLEALGIKSRSTLQKDRVAGRGIPYIKIGKLVRYRPADVEQYIFDLPTLHSTSEADAHVVQAGIERRAIAKAEPSSGPVSTGRKSEKRSTPPSAPQRASRALSAVPERAHPRHRPRDEPVGRLVTNMTDSAGRELSGPASESGTAETGQVLDRSIVDAAVPSLPSARRRTPLSYNRTPRRERC